MSLTTMWIPALGGGMIKTEMLIAYEDILPSFYSQTHKSSYILYYSWGQWHDTWWRLPSTILEKIACSVARL